MSHEKDNKEKENGVYSIGGTVEKEDAGSATISKQLTKLRLQAFAISQSSSDVVMITYPGAILGSTEFNTPTFLNFTIVCDTREGNMLISLPSSGLITVGDTYLFQRGLGSGKVFIGPPAHPHQNSTLVSGTLSSGLKAQVSPSILLASPGSVSATPNFGDFVQLQCISNTGGVAVFVVQGSTGSWDQVNDS